MNSNNDDLKQNFDDINQTIVQAARDANRPDDAVKLLAVSKTFPIESIQKIYNLGQRSFGESKIQELEEKYKNLPEDIQWHLIGHLQSNKVGKAIEYADFIDSVDSIKLLERIEFLAKSVGKIQNILIEVNLSGEENKFGVAPEALVALVSKALTSEHIKLHGLMGMGPLDASEEENRQCFDKLRQLRDRMEQRFDCKLPVLSMGMSNDFKTAIQAGSTQVRIGSALFGKREYL